MADDSPNSDKSWFDRLSQLISGEPADRHDLVEILRASSEREILDADALSIIEGALTVSEMQVREIMIPRSQVVSVRMEMGPDEFLPLIIESGHSRFPVIGDNPDDIIGILLAKDLLSLALREKQSKFSLRDILRPSSAVPESKRLNVLLQEFRSTHNHLAVVYDEYGGVSGIVTIEDVLEQIVGDIEDEYDFDEDDFIMPHTDNTYTVKAHTPVEDFNQYFGVGFSEDDFDTIGGIVTQHFGHLPKRDEKVAVEEFKFTVLNSDNRRIRLLRVRTPVDHVMPDHDEA